MITNLFRVFDPASSVILASNWLRSLIVFIFLISRFWLTPNRISFTFKKITQTLFYEIKTLLGPINIIGSPIIFIAILLIIVFNNFIGLFPYIFTRTSHIICSLSLSLPIWVSFIIYGWFNSYNHILAHLVPQSTPSALISFIVVIETVSNIIRPLTLAVRLSANIIAGHLLITLLGNQTSSALGVTLIILLGTQIVLFTLETAVAVIQSYVFAVFSSLYYNEICVYL
jgi:F-type H+-transporting ATPase subunit a